MAISRERIPERAILVGLAERGPRRSGPLAHMCAPGANGADSPEPDSLAELTLLAMTAGSQVVGRLLQRRGSIHAGRFLSRGKLDELAALVASANADLVLCDEDLSPVQARNLQQTLECKVIDRTELILDIFATRARTREAQLQVELAQLEYILPRLTRLWVHLSRLGGGIGTRGPGETQLGVDRRRVRERIGVLKRRLEAQNRRRQALFRVSLVGYTNAGKSTLFNQLTHAGVLEEDKLFATLDTTTRRLGLPGGEVLLLSDTVGFIRKLPHHLVASFRATLREAREADLLVHVADAAQPALRAQIESVEEVLDGLLDGRPVQRLLLFNKADLLNEMETHALRAEFPHATLLSALRSEDIGRLRDLLAEALREHGPSGRRL
jgi:GTP-binding protein HflX